MYLNSIPQLKPMCSTKFLFTTILFFLLQINSLVFAQTGNSVSGTIQGEDGNKLAGVNVVLKGTTIGTITKDDGYFKLSIARAGSYTLVVSSVGYLSQSRVISLKNGQEVKANFTLKFDSKNMDEVVVHGKTKTQEVKEQAFAVNAIETKQFANTTADLNQVLNRTAGIKVREEGGMGSDFNFSINGLSGKAVKFFLDGDVFLY